MLFVGNLPYAADPEALQELLMPFGEVITLELVIDRITGRSRGFAFVALASAEQEIQAMESLDKTQWGGRSLRVEPYVAKKNNGA